MVDIGDSHTHGSTNTQFGAWGFMDLHMAREIVRYDVFLKRGAKSMAQEREPARGAHNGSLQQQP
eukprot:1217559-Amphidinium_carterae.1